VFAARDYDASVTFYRDGLELPVVESWDDPDGKGTVFQAAAGQIEVLETTDDHPYTVPQGIRIAFEVEDIDEYYRDLLARSVTVEREPTDWPWKHRNIEVHDPDGIVINPFQLIE
jgi:catechol 2,3-dioxygenase-like lactoylglutathione lyase family enzyme